MKKIILALALFMVAGAANAAWCRAESPSGFGVGYAFTIPEACGIALAQCSNNTPYWQYCGVVSSGY